MSVYDYSMVPRKKLRYLHNVAKFLEMHQQDHLATESETAGMTDKKRPTVVYTSKDSRDAPAGSSSQRE